MAWRCYSLEGHIFLVVLINVEGFAKKEHKF